MTIGVTVWPGTPVEASGCVATRTRGEGWVSEGPPMVRQADQAPSCGRSTMTHDYKRHGTTTLFAALDVLTGEVIGSCLPRHRHSEFLKFLKGVSSSLCK